MSATTVPQKTSQQAFSRKVAGLVDQKAPGTAAESASAVREGLPYEALETLSHALGLTQEVLTRVLGASERTLQRRRRSGCLSPSESDRLWRIDHIYHLALGAFDGRTDAARAWLTAPKQALGGDTPIEHLDTEPGARMVEQMLATIEHMMPA